MIILLKTTGDRPEMLAEAVAAWERVADAELRIVGGREPLGVGINRGYQDVEDDEIAVQVCDDTVPLFTDLEGALAMYQRREQPAPRFLRIDGTPWASYDGNPDGSPATWTRLPMASGRLHREIGPMLATTNFTDFDYSERLSLAGWKIRLCHAFSFTHLDGSHSWQNPELDAHELALYREAHAAREGPAA